MLHDDDSNCETRCLYHTQPMLRRRAAAGGFKNLHSGYLLQRVATDGGRMTTTTTMQQQQQQGWDDRVVLVGPDMISCGAVDD